MDTLLRDIRYALRALARQRAFTLTAVATLALGIGANTAMFSIVYGVLLRPLPYPQPEAIVQVGVLRAGQTGTGFLSNTSLPSLQEQARSFEYLAAIAPRSLAWRGPEGPIVLRGAMVSPALFPLLRATPHLGRLFAEGESLYGAHRVALLSFRTWQNRFASDPDVVGAPLELGGEPYTVAGVLSEGFSFPSPEEEIWTPMVIPPFEGPDRTGGIAVSFLFTALGRLRAGVSPEQAAAEMQTILQPPDAGRLSDTRPPGGGQPSSGRPEREARVTPLQEELVGEYRPALLVLAAATALVLLIACVNVAGLLLARGVTRQRELALRGALGAARGRIVRQLLTESMVLSVAGGAVGLAAAAVILRAVPALVPGDIPRIDEVTFDGTVLAVTAGLSLVVGLLFGAVPALQWSRLNLVRTLNEGSAQSAGGFRFLRANRTRAALAVAQVALALVLIVGAGLLLRSFVELVSVDLGYDPANVVAASVDNPEVGSLFFAGPVTTELMADRNAATRRFYDTLLDRMTRVERLPGVEAVGISSVLPLGRSGGSSTSVRLAGRPEPADPSERMSSRLHFASRGYFDVMRLHLRNGRIFSRLDTAGSPRVAVVNDTLVREILDGGPAVGQRLLLGRDEEPWTVIGVVADVNYQGFAAADARAEIYLSAHQIEMSPAFSLDEPRVSIRTTGDPIAAVPFLREAVADVHPGAALDDVMTMDARLSASIAQPRFYAVFVGLFAAVALFLAAFGIYGLLSYTVSQRRGEIGIRMALGAQRGDIVALVGRQGALLIAGGAVLGLPAAAASTRVLESLLFGVTMFDWLTFVAGPLVLIAVALAACWLPARRATRINPMDALRVE